MIFEKSAPIEGQWLLGFRYVAQNQCKARPRGALSLQDKDGVVLVNLDDTWRVCPGPSNITGSNCDPVDSSTQFGSKPRETKWRPGLPNACLELD